MEVSDLPRLITRVLILGGLASAGMMFTGAKWGWLYPGALTAAGIVVWLSRCHHRQPLSLLPPIVDEHGVRTPAKWYCADCGKSWPAGFEHERVAPVRRFSGYDQSKAALAAKRADELAERQRELAIKRAGLSRRRVSPPVEQAKGPVPIRERRAG
jgi:hypothetical protein